MASAVLASQNESSWAHMGKNPYSNFHLNANPNPNPTKKQKQLDPAAANGVSASRFHVNNHNIDSPAVTQTAPDDAYSFNQTSPSCNAVNYRRYLTFNVASYSKSELFELRKRLSTELEHIRNLRDRIDFGHLNKVENPRSQANLKKLPRNKRPGALGGSIHMKLSNQNVDGTDVANFDGLLKECSKIVGKLIKHKYGYVFKTPVDAAALGLHDYHSIVKCPMDLGSVKSNIAKNLYRTPCEFADDVRLTFNNALLYNPKSDPVNMMAEQLLTRFEEFFRPIQEKINNSLRQRKEPVDCQFRAIDEPHYRSLEEFQECSWNNNHNPNQAVPSPVRAKKTKPKASYVPIVEVLKKPGSAQSHSSASTASNPPPLSQKSLIQEPLPPSPPRAIADPTNEQIFERARGAVKLPKPKAKDQHKRDMSMEEKQKLGMGLQSLPEEKMPQLLHIVRKRNQHMAQDGDEIELDIEALDTETLWELDRFVTNWKKLLSKTKRQALMTNPEGHEVAPPASPSADTDLVVRGVMNDKNDNDDDDDVDIDDDMPVASFPPVEIEKDEGPCGGQDDDDHIHGRENENRGNASSSSSSSGSSSSDSSSSTDSDSASSSGTNSDADDAQS